MIKEALPSGHQLPYQDWKTHMKKDSLYTGKSSEIGNEGQNVTAENYRTMDTC